MFIVTNLFCYKRNKILNVNIFFKFRLWLREKNTTKKSYKIEINFSVSLFKQVNNERID